MRNIVVSFSGGRTSALMAKMMKESDEFSEAQLLFVFANTGREREETLEFVDRCDKEFGLGLIWVEAEVNPSLGDGTTHRIVTFESASRDGRPFEDMLRKYGISNKAFPHCTRELKNRPINSYAKSVFGRNHTTAIGIRFDEIGRVKATPGVIYPMIQWGLTIIDVRKFWSFNHFDLQLRDYEGNCDLCWKKSLRKQLTLISENPDVAKWWIEMENKYSNIDKHGKAKPPYFFHRGNRSTLDLIDLAKNPFVPVTDPFWRQQANTEMDSESSCACASDSEPQLDLDFD